MPDALQDKSTLTVSQIGGYDFVLLSIYGTESLGRMYQYELELASEDAQVDCKKVLGQNATVTLLLDTSDDRYFNGYISRISLISIDLSRKGKLYIYRATLVPAMWFLTRCSDCRIFQTMTVPEIVEKVYKDRVGLEVTSNLTGSYRKWDYCVQYRETEFNFISRLLENEGIYYYFEHDNGKHKLVLCDAQTSHEKVTDYEEIKFDLPDVGTGTGKFLWNWVLGYEITPNQYSLTEYDPLQPQANLVQIVSVDHDHDPQAYEIFDYPGGYSDPGDGRKYTDARMKELVGAYSVAHATSSARGLLAGCKFKLVDHETDENEYLITSAAYRINNDDLGLTIGSSGEEGSFQCQITCIPKEQEFRTPRTTPKPTVQGPQTAVVVGPAGEEIYTDKYGRVKVQFFWDREGKKDENSSCWIRVSQTWAGKTWGAISIPRIGQEVIVEFLEGDPDRPIITGRVYNAENMPPYALPANKTMTTFKSNSSKGGGGFNELRFEDKKDSEQIFMWAQKNMDVNIQNDRFETIKHDTHLTVTNNQYLNVKNEVHTKVSSHTFEDIGGDLHTKVSGKEAKAVTGSKSLKVTGNVIEEFGANHSSVVTDQLLLKATDVIIQGTGSVTIKVGGSSIAMDDNGIQIKTGGKIDLISTGNTTIAATADFKATGMNCTVEATMQLSLKGMMSELKGSVQVTVEASGILTAKGGIIMLN